MNKISKVQFLVVCLGSFSFVSFAQNMQISGGYLHTVALCASGAVYHTGDRNNNQDGTGAWTGANNLSLTAVPGVGGVGSLTAIKMIDAGSTHHSIALTNSGDVLAFGNDYACQLGQGGTSGSYPANPSPVKGVGGVGNLTGVKYISASSESSYAIRASDDALLAWGNNSVGQLGIASTGGIQCNPVAVVAPCNSNVIQVDGGDNFALALLSNGTVYAWGENMNGQLGIGNTTDQSSPQQVLVSAGVPLTNVVSISCGDGTSYAIKNDGTLWSWGHNGWGQMGVGTCNPINSYAQQVKTGDQGDASGFLQNVKQVVGGNAHAVIVLNDGNVYTMGSDQYGQLGDGAVGGADACGLGIGCKNLPYHVTSLSGMVAVSEGDHWSFASDATGQVYAWGQNTEGQLGINSGTATIPNPTAMTQPAGCVILPVDLLYFRVSPDRDHNITITWATASEKNTTVFEILRSIDGIHFFSIGKEQAAGNSSIDLNYSFIDFNFPEFSGTVYYKLKIIDTDGSFEFSKTESVFSGERQVGIYPTILSSGGNFHIMYNQEELTLIKIQLTDILAQTVLEVNGTTIDNGSSLVVSLPQLETGMYVLRVIFSDHVEEKKVIVR